MRAIGQPASVLPGRLGDVLRHLVFWILHAEVRRAQVMRIQNATYTNRLADFMHIKPVQSGRGVVYPLQITPARKLAADPSPARCAITRVKHGRADRTLMGCTGVRARDWTRVLRSYVLPRVRVRDDRFARAGGDAELVVHLRGGDVMAAVRPPSWRRFYTSLQESHPPCALYEWVLTRGHRGGPYRSVRIVTEADRRNPCIGAIQRAAAKVGGLGVAVRVQSESRGDDAAAPPIAQRGRAIGAPRAGRSAPRASESALCLGRRSSTRATCSWGRASSRSPSRR